MTRLLVALAVALASGCAHSTRRPQPVERDTAGYCEARCFNYPRFDLAICVTCWERMQRECGRDRDGNWDDGKRRQAGEPVGACSDGITRTIWLDENRPKSLLHELCHADGSWSNRTCGKYFHWEKP